MFYKMIEAKRNQWLASADCTIMPLIDYMKKAGQLRDAQLDAIKTYLFLKITCENRPLADLFCKGVFNSLDLSALEISSTTRDYFAAHPAAAALYEYATLRNDANEQVSEKLAQILRQEPEAVNCERIFKALFYGVTYTDYLFSLPMGAGKTYLMAAFIYLDLYFARNEPQNPAFAHNFMIFAPSGLKSSVIPSLKTIQRFDPAWILPEPAASDIRRLISFEVLDQEKTANKSNKTKNPNVQKIASHQPLPELFGLVAVTNAEKVILGDVKTDMQISMDDDTKDIAANELRYLIGTLPSLAIFIDEVHHAVDDEIKLRAVVNRWAERQTVNCVIGFSGTPYLSKADRIAVTDGLTIANAEITNVVYYYPLIRGVGNFLKQPTVAISNAAHSGEIIEQGVRKFLDTYKDTVYAGGLTAKLGIYCGTIEKLEELVYPLVSRILSEYGLGADSILKFHKGNKQYSVSADSQMLFDTLDRETSPIRIVLLVQIGKEGWDCRSLTGIILSQEGDCPKNMVLQTSCRCLRQVVKGQPETALIYLNESNAEKLTAQLQQEQHISLQEFQSGARTDSVKLKRYDRTDYLKLPTLDFYQFKVDFTTSISEPATPESSIPQAPESGRLDGTLTRTTDLHMEHFVSTYDTEEHGTEPAAFTAWLYEISKSSFGTLSMTQLEQYRNALKAVFDTITYPHGDNRRFSSHYDRKKVETAIRKAFCDKRDFESTQELIPETAALLNIANFTLEVSTEKTEDYYPAQDMVERIIQDDKGKLKADAKTQQLIDLAEDAGQSAIVDMLRAKITSHPKKNRTYHYLPYHMDSALEQMFFDGETGVLSLPELNDMDLEVYYNGDRAMTEFKIKCYRHSGNRWNCIGMYTPDFLILRRKDGAIHQAVIVETKGSAYESQFEDKKTFMETAFVPQNNERAGYPRFEFLYLPDSLSGEERLKKTRDKICEFFGEVSFNAD